MAEMVDSPLHLEAFLCGSALREGHHACVVDKIVKAREGDAVDEGVDGAATGEVKRNELYLCIWLFFFD